MITSSQQVTGEAREPQSFPNFVQSLADEVFSKTSNRVSLLIGKNGVGKSFVLGRLLDLSLTSGHLSLAASFGVSDRFPFTRRAEYVYIGTRSSANAIHGNSIDSKIFDAIVSGWRAPEFRLRLSQICELLDLPASFRVEVTVKHREAQQHPADFLMNAWAARAGSGLVAWGRLGDRASYSQEQRDEFKRVLNMKYKLTIDQMERALAMLHSIDGLSGSERTWQRGTVPIEAFSEAGELRNAINALRFMGVVRQFSLIIGTTEMDTSWLSSGQKNLLFTLVQICRYIKDDSFLLIDEPEISLHPAWQTEYISFLDKILGGIKCRIVIATHSPFMTVSGAAIDAAIFSLRASKGGHSWQRIESLSGISVDVAAVDGFGVRYASSPQLEQLLFAAVEILGDPEARAADFAALHTRLSPMVRDKFDPMHAIVEKLKLRIENP